MGSPSPERLRLQKKAVGRMNALKQSSSEEEYYAECRRMSTTSGLGYNEVRATVWRDLVLGAGVQRTVPYLSDSMIVVRRPALSSNGVSASSSSSGGSHAHRAAQDDSSLTTDDDVSSAASACPARPPRKSVSVLSQRVKSDAVSVPDGGRQDGPVQAKPTSSFTGQVPAGGSSTAAPTTVTNTTQPMKLPENCQPKVVEADVERSLWHLYPETTQRTRMRKQLKAMIIRILAFRRDRHYYQGLHELMGFVMYVMAPTCADDIIVSVCERLLLTQWSAFSEPTLSKSQALLYAMHAVVAEEDPTLATALEACGVGPESHYAVSWVITWYTHSLKDPDRVGRLFDYFIADEDPWNVIFFTASFILTEKDQILAAVEAAKEEMGQEADKLMLMARVYALLVKLPEMTLEAMTNSQVDLLIARAAGFRRCYMPLVTQEADNFMNGDVRDLGMLANLRTRNAALRLLWRLLPREWRNPTARRGLQTLALWTGVLLTAAVGVLASTSRVTGANGHSRGG